MPDAALEVRDLVVGYSGVPIVEGVSLEARRGEVVSILGPNGAGKSTLLKGIFGLIRRFSGSVILAGRDISGERPDVIAGQGMGYVPQVENVFPNLTVAENLRMGAYLKPRELAQRRNDILELFPDLKPSLRRKAGTLSGGQRNMLAMARGLMLMPSVLLLDEPTAGLAPMVAQEVWTRVRAVAERSTAVVIIEQNVTHALQFSDRAYVLVAGRNRYDGTPAALEQQDLGAMFLGN